MEKTFFDMLVSPQRTKVYFKIGVSDWIAAISNWYSKKDEMVQPGNTLTLHFIDGDLQITFVEDEKCPICGNLKRENKDEKCL